MWIVLAFLSALFAGATAILAKCGIQKVNSNVATALRTGVVLIFATMSSDEFKKGQKISPLH